MQFTYFSIDVIRPIRDTIDTERILIESDNCEKRGGLLTGGSVLFLASTTTTSFAIKREREREAEHVYDR